MLSELGILLGRVDVQEHQWRRQAKTREDINEFNS